MKLLISGLILAIAGLACGDDPIAPGSTAIDVVIAIAPSVPPGDLIITATVTNVGGTRTVIEGWQCTTVPLAIWGSEGPVYHQSPCLAGAVRCASPTETLGPGQRYVEELRFNGSAWDLDFVDGQPQCTPKVVDPGSYNVRARISYHTEGVEESYVLLSEPESFQWYGVTR